jgi:hypothetical protein
VLVCGEYLDWLFGVLCRLFGNGIRELFLNAAASSGVADFGFFGLREQVAKALVNKGARLGVLGRSDEAIAVYADVLARFGTATELALREQVAKALVNKGARLGVVLLRSEI